METKKTGSRMDRRDFIRGAAAIAAAGLVFDKAGNLLGVSPQAHAATAAKGESLIIRVASDHVWKDKRTPDASVVSKMVSEGIRTFTGEKTDAAAWGSLFTKDDVVGVKLSALGGPTLCTNKEIVDAIVEGLTSAGVKENNIIVWERFGYDLRSLKLKENTGSTGVRIFTSEIDRGVDGRGYDDNVFVEIDGQRGPVTKIMTEDVTAVINVPVLKDHGLSGITNALKNMAFGSTRNPRNAHSNNCEPYISSVCALPQIRDKVRLVIVDALQALAEGGPRDNPAYKWQMNELIFASDMVAVDSVGWSIIEAKRKEFKLPKLAAVGREPTHIANAAKKGIGTNDKNKIKVKSVTV